MVYRIRLLNWNDGGQYSVRTRSHHIHPSAFCNWSGKPCRRIRKKCDFFSLTLLFIKKLRKKKWSLSALHKFQEVPSQPGLLEWHSALCL
ncbi:hypothetical protein ANCDUO_12452 [Ancylostoma duodenale]|uniref:Uncharacterized protein n=1 Tax=Ancylostoma duodenale TaxID=51022 RepID=A0A0C2D5K1_9BILA|nr:hypothetical protein ANCDUO_12452 [Ancylostoma duodenale]